ncbi:MAG TPA: hypothetical protein VLL52_10895 [Anaerolineae bacterium]|nr:hypothetical protein [Anaerolineae bacterium]
MANRAFFEGLVFDEFDRPLKTHFVGAEAVYIIDDNGFKRHVSSEAIDRQVLQIFLEGLQDNRDMAVTQAMKMMGKEDLFTKAAIDAKLNNLDMDEIIQQGMPQQARDMIGMMGFRIVVDYRGDIVRVDHPAMPDDPGGDF